MVSRRDEWVWKICNWLLNNLATPEYGKYISLATKYGILRLAQEEGNAEEFRKYWMPDKETKYKMLAGFLTDSESAVLTADNGDIVFLNSKEIKVSNQKDLLTGK